MRRLVGTLCALVCFLGSQPSAASSLSLGRPAGIHLAAVLSLTGSYGSIGHQEEVALKTAVAIANATGGVDGRQVVLDVEDDQSSSAAAIATAKWLVSTDRPVAIIGGSFESTCAAMRPITQSAGVVQYCLSGAPTDGGLFFASFPSPGRAFGDLPAEWMHRVGYTRVAILASDDRAGRLYAHAIDAAARGQHLEIVDTAVIDGTPQIAAQVDAALKLHPGILYLGLTREGAAAVFTALRARGSTIPVWLVSADATRVGAQNLAPLLPPGPVYSAATKLALVDRLPDTDPQKSLLQRFSSSFEALDPGHVPDIFAAIAADSTEFLIAGLRADHGQGGHVLAETIEQMPRAPGLYAWYHFGPYRHNGTELPGVIVRFTTRGELDYVTTIEDGAVPSYAHVSLPPILRPASAQVHLMPRS